MHCKVGMVFPGKYTIRHFVEDLDQLCRMVLADGKDYRLPDFAAHRIAQGVLQKCLTEELVGTVGKKTLLELPLFECFLLVFACIVCKRNNEPLFREQVRSNVGTGIHHGRINQIAFFHPVEQRVAERGLAVLTTEGAVGVKQQSPLRLSGGAGSRRFFDKSLQIVARSCGKTQLVANKKIKDSAGIAANRAVRFVGYDQVEIGW